MTQINTRAPGRSFAQRVLDLVEALRDLDGLHITTEDVVTGSGISGSTLYRSMRHGATQRTSTKLYRFEVEVARRQGEV